MLAEPKSRQQLALDHPDSAWQEKFRTLFSLTVLLEQCIISRDYKIPDSLNDAIKLTTSGRQVRDKLVDPRGAKVSAKTARLLVFLQFVHIEPLVDVEATNVEDVVRAISEEIHTRRILLAPIMGAEGYRRMASLFKDEKRYLRHEETLRLLEDLPQGVGHFDRYIFGPFGILVVGHRRSLAPSNRNPLQHCHDIGCDIVHRISISTSPEAEVNRERVQLHRVLDEIALDPSDWNGFFEDVFEGEVERFKEEGDSLMPYVLAECLSASELRLMFRKVLDSKSGIRGVLEGLGYRGSAEIIDSQLEDAEVLQVMLTETDSSLRELLDSLVWSRQIELGIGETRRPRVSASVRKAAWRLKPELGLRGVRFVNSDSSFAAKRLVALIGEIFRLGDAAAEAELAWALRDIEGEDTRDRLSRATRMLEPRDLLTRLFLSSRERAVQLSAKLSLGEIVADDDLLKTAEWRLGFRGERQRDMRDEYWSEHALWERIARSASMDPTRELGSVRSVATNYFVAVEHLLQETLFFSTWALLNDHFSSSEQFVYYPEVARMFAQESLTIAAKALGDSGQEVIGEGSIGSLLYQFGLLARYLKNIDSDSSSHLRTSSMRPKYAEHSSLEVFPFDHVVPYLDLTEQSRSRIEVSLATVCADLQRSGLSEARNSLLHARRRAPDLQGAVEALEVSARVFRNLEALGLTCRTVRIDEVVADEWGRSRSSLSSLDGARFDLLRPTLSSWSGMPAHSVDQFVMNGALLAKGGVALRFVRGYDSEFLRTWQDFPTRPTRGSAAIVTDALIAEL